jgi:hypothetical protein
MESMVPKPLRTVVTLMVPSTSTALEMAANMTTWM